MHYSSHGCFFDSQCTPSWFMYSNCLKASLLTHSGVKIMQVGLHRSRIAGTYLSEICKVGRASLSQIPFFREKERHYFATHTLYGWETVLSHINVTYDHRRSCAYVGSAVLKIGL